MKKHYFIYLLLMLITLSCIDSTQKYEKNLKDLLGEWQLRQMSYTNEADELVDVEQLSSSLIFSDVNTTQADGNITKMGTLVVEGDSIEITYQFNFYSNYISIDIDREEIKDKPLYTFGKVQMNDFELIDENKLLFSSEFEFVYPTNKKLTKPVYVFVR